MNRRKVSGCPGGEGTKISGKKGTRVRTSANFPATVRAADEWRKTGRVTMQASKKEAGGGHGRQRKKCGDK